MIKFSLIFLAVMLCIVQLQAQQLYYAILNQKANDMVYDSATSQLLISIPASDTAHGNSIGYISPDPALFLHASAVGDGPVPLALTYNGKYLYVGLNEAASIIKMEISTGATLQSFSVGSDPFIGAMHARNISCKPGTDSEIAVARQINGASPGTAGAVIFKQGVLLPNTVAQYSVTIGYVAFQSPTALYAFNNENSNFDFYTIATNSLGASLVSDTNNIMTGINNEFYIHGTMAVSDNGTVADLSGILPVVIGTYNVPLAFHPKACFDKYMNLMCFAYNQGDTTIIERFNTSTFLNYDKIKIPGIHEDIKRLVIWGDSSNYAFCTKGEQLVIVGRRRSSVTGVPSLTNLNQRFSVYPNPTSENLFFNSPEEIQFEMINSVGESVLAGKAKNTISLKSLSPGMYVIQAKDFSGSLIGIKKVIRN